MPGIIPRPIPITANDTEARARLKAWMNTVVDSVEAIQAQLANASQDLIQPTTAFRGHFDSLSPRYAAAAGDFDLTIDPGIILKGSTRIDFDGDTLTPPASGAGLTYVYIQLIQATSVTSLETDTTKPDFDDSTNYNIIIGTLDETETGYWEWTQHHLGTFTIPYPPQAGTAISVSGYTVNFKYKNSIVIDSDQAQLDGDIQSPGNCYIYATDTNGDKSWQESTLVDAITAIRYNAGKIQIKTTGFYGMLAQAETAWGDIITLDQLTAITDNQVSGSTIQEKTRTLYGFGAGTESGWTTWHTGTTCAGTTTSA